MDSIEKHFEYMDALQCEEDELKDKQDQPDTTKKTLCCEKKENIQMDQGMIRCKECMNVISNITNNPEWRYYGPGDNKSLDPTRCGMPINTLLPGRAPEVGPEWDPVERWEEVW